MAIVGTQLASESRLSLNSDSLDYIAEIKGLSTEAGFEDIKDTESADSSQLTILDSGENASVNDQSDFLPHWRGSKPS